MCIRDRLEAQTGEKLTPSVLSKRLAKYAAVLEQNGIRVVSERTCLLYTSTEPEYSILRYNYIGEMMLCQYGGG